MKKLLTFLTLLTLFFGVGWAAEGIIWFGNQGTNINSAYVHGTDDKNNTWYITTEGTSSFTPSSAYSQVGSSKNPATSITFTTTLPSSVNITSMEAKFGGFSGTSGSVNLKVGDTNIGTGSLNESTDVTVTSNSTANGKVLTVTVTNISKGVKCYYISYQYEEGGQQEPDNPTAPSGTISFNPAAGEVVSGTEVEISCTGSYDGIKYTTDGSSPSATNGTVYNASNKPTITEATTIKAAAYNYSNSKYAFGTEASASYTVSSTTPSGDGYFITFGDNGNDANAATTAAILKSEYTIAGVEYVDSYEINNFVAKGETGLKFASGKNPGTLTINLSAAGQAINAQKVIVKAYGSNKTMNVTINNGTAVSKTVTSSYADYEFDASGSISTIVIHAAKDNAIHVKSIEIVPAVAKTYDVTVTQPTEGGTITASPVGEKVVDAGDKITVTATASPGYELTGWTITGANESAPDANNQITATGNVTITASFSKVNYTITKATMTNGNVTVPATANYGDVVTITPEPATDYVVDKVYYNDGTDHEIAVNNNAYTFTMPASNVTVWATFVEHYPTLRLAGRFNGRSTSSWVTDSSGPEFTYDTSTEKYTIDAYFIGASQDEGSDVDFFYLRSDDDDLKANASGNCWVSAEGGTYNLGGSSNFRIYPGVYNITVNKARTSITFTKITPVLTFSPNGGEVEAGQTVTVTSNLQTLVDNIKNTYDSGATGTVNHSVSTDQNNWDDNVTLNTIGSATVYGRAVLGNIYATGNAAYNVVAANTSTQYQLIKSTDDLIAGKKYIIVSTGSYTASGTTYNFTKAAGAPNAANNLILDADVTISDEIVDLDGISGVTEFTLGGSTGKWTFAFGDGTYLASSAAKSAKADVTATPASISFNGNEATINMGSVGSFQYNPNNGNGRFAAYASTQRPVMLFKQVEGTVTQKSAAPVITPEGGNIVGYSQEVEITQANGGTIYYTTDGTTPTETSAQYTGKFWAEGTNLGDEVTITAVAKEEGKELSNPVSVTYKFVAPVAPVFTPAGGTYTTAQEVSISSTTEGADVYYTTDGSTPSVTHGTKYTEPIPVTANVTIKAITVYHDAHADKDAVTSPRQAKYTIVTDGIVEVENIAEFNAIQPDEDGEYPEVRFKNPVTVLYDYSQYSKGTYQEYIWVKDETGFTQIFLQPSLDGQYGTNEVQRAYYENGDVIPAGFIVTKQYYTNGGYYQAFSNQATEEGKSGFQEATTKALADPEPFTVAELANLQMTQDNIDTYNNRYVRVNKLKITSKSEKNFYFTNDQNITVTTVGYNKYSDTGSVLKDGTTTAVVDVPDAGNTYYNVTAILQKWDDVWEIMPITFTPWEEKTVTLRELCDKGDVNNTYTISNPLQVVYVDTDEKSVWVKDDNGQSILKTVPEDPNSENFAIDYADNTRSEQANYDQSNWCQLVFASADDIPSSFASNPIINGGIITGKFTNKMNPTLEITNLGEDPIMTASSNYDPNYYVAANFSGPQLGYFFMNPKPQEYAHIVWAIYDEDNNAMIMTSNPKQNPNGFKGSFKVNMSMNINPNLELVDGTQTGKGYEHFKAIVRLASTSNAPMLKDRMPANTEYVVFPLDITQDVPTGITDVNGKAVKSVKYVNVAGVMSDVPFEGVNIVVTEYTDGSRSTSKMIKR